jgi:PAS domain S-box-containing protein
LVLANLPADLADRRRALWVAGALVVTFLLIAPFAGQPLVPFPGFVLIYQAALVIVDLITAVFLFGLLRVTGSRAILVLACGYVFTACMAVSHGLSFPGAFTPEGLLDGGESTPWLFFVWHAAFPLVVLAYVMLRRREHIDADGRAVVPGETGIDSERFARWASSVGSATALVAAVACTLVVALGNDYFPALTARNHFALGGTGVGWILLGVTLAALAATLTRRPYSILDLWLGVVLCAWAIDIALVSLLNHGRYDVGFYLGRTYGLLASGLMMVVLLAEQSKFYAALVDAQRAMQAAAALRENRDVLALAMRAGRMGVWSRDLRDERVWWSSELEEIFGLAVGSFKGTELDFLDFVHEDDRPLITTAVGDAIASHGDYSVEFRFRHASGEWRWMEGRGRAVYDDSGVAIMLHGLGIDITARWQAQAALIESESRFRTLADNIAQLAWMADPSGQVVWYNKRFLDYTGATTEEMATRGWRSVHHPDHVERVAAIVRRGFERGESWEDTFPLRARDGSYRWFLSRAMPIRDEAGNVLRWFGTSTDVTAEREAADALREMDRRKDEFLAILAHELRNPLAPLHNALEILDRFDPASEQAVWARALIARQVAHMTRLVDDLMDVSRVTRGTIELRQERTSAQAIVERAIETSRPLFERNGLSLAVDVPQEPLALDGDVARLTQAVANLLNNAARYTPRGGHVTVRAQRHGDEVAIVVEDDGAGIRRDLLERIFDMFAQGPQSRGQGGLGIGLTLARTLVGMHRGRIEAWSAGEGQGSRFTVTLPLATRAVDARAGLQPGSQLTHVVPRRILVVDDNVDAALSLEMLLTQMGHEVAVAHDGHAAIGRAEAFLPDVIFLDLALPGLSGYDVARSLRERKTVNGVRLVALTGYSQQEDRRKSHEAGFDAHLVKPADVDAIGRALDA